MHRTIVFVSGLVGLVFAAAACGNSGSSYSSASTPGATSAPAAAAKPGGAGFGIKTAPDASLGQILVDAGGRAVYLFEADSGSTSNCYGACAQAWPPVLTTGSPVAGNGAVASLLGTTTRKDGTVEVTYSGHPLYYFVADRASGDTKGQGLNNFGGPWYVLAPSGTKIDKT